MLNKDDRDKSYEDHDESEYHFSEDEVNYELDAEPKEETPATASGNIFTRMSRSKRMLVSALVFLGLVFVVYKMVAPTTAPVVPTDIAPPPAAIAPTAMAPQPREPVVAVTPPPPAPQPLTPETLSATAPVPSTASTAPGLPPPGTMAQATVQPVMQAPMPAAPSVATPSGQPIESQPVATVAPTQPMMPPSYATSTQMPAPGGMMPQVAPAAPSVAPVAATPSQMMQQIQPAAQFQQPITPGVPSAPVSTMGVPPEMPLTTTTTTTMQVPSAQAVSPNVAAQPGTMMQADYAQRMDEYINANRDLQNQMQALNSRVISMENQFNQLVRTLTRQANEENQVTQTAPPAPVAQKIPYTVQAIIPGRAWLRSDNGETVTVAEGDVIKDLGRITKIDPYDGIVEINTGRKTVTLTYGTSN